MKGARTTKAGAAKTQRVTAWSFSRWSDYETCPERFKHKHIDKLPDPSGPAAQRGGELHQLCERFLTGTIKEVPVELEGFAAELRTLRRVKAKPEAEWALNEKLEPTGWFDADCWVRVKTDAHFLKRRALTVVDFKSGKMRSGYEPQLELYALAGFAMYPDAATVVAELWFLDHNTIVGGFDDVGMFERERDFAQLESTWRGRTRMMLADARFAPTPGMHCTWCPYSKKKSGPCKF